MTATAFSNRRRSSIIIHIALAFNQQYIEQFYDFAAEKSAICRALQDRARLLNQDRTRIPIRLPRCSDSAVGSKPQ